MTSKTSTRILAVAVLSLGWPMASVGGSDGGVVPVRIGVEPAQETGEHWPRRRFPSIGSAIYGQRTADWWQWAFSLPNVKPPEADEDCLLDENCSTHPLVGNDDSWGADDLFEYCGNGQHGDLWFLGGDFAGTGEPIERTCIIPAGKTILLPLINLECATVEGDADPTDTIWKQSMDLTAVCEDIANDFYGSAQLVREDGTLRDINVQRLATRKAFLLSYGPNYAGEPAYAETTSLAQADGLWVILRNLEPGNYRLEFNGDYMSPPVFQIVGAYNLRITQPNGYPVD
jgi:hypothetical protein